MLNWFSDCATLNMIREKLPEPPLHLSLEMVFVLRSFAGDTPSPQLPWLFYLYLSGTLKGSSRECCCLSDLFSLNTFTPPECGFCPLHQPSLGGSGPALSWGFKYDKRRLPTRWLSPNESASLRDVGMGLSLWP